MANNLIIIESFTSRVNKIVSNKMIKRAIKRK